MIYRIPLTYFCQLANFSVRLNLNTECAINIEIRIVVITATVPRDLH